MNIGSFLLLMLPYTLVSFVLLAAYCLYLGKKCDKGNTKAPFQSFQAMTTRTHLQGSSRDMVRYLLLFALSLMTVAGRIPYLVTLGIVLVVLVLFDRQLFAKIDAQLKNDKVILAIDGRSGSGKTTLGELLKAAYKCNVIHMDDFFLRPEQRTKERYNEAGGNVDRERFLAEVLIPLSRGESFTYRPFNCAEMDFGDPVSVIPTELTVIEGAYSTHPDLSSYYNIKVFLDVTKEEQETRIFMRGEEKAKAFFEKWIPLEEKYIKELSVMERCDIRLNGIDK
jgi:uridine kinase